MSISGVNFIEDFLPESGSAYEHLLASVSWDERMFSRKTASFGVPYNYSQIDYPAQEFLPFLADINQQIQAELSFLPNNCLLNYYPEGRSKMGFHSDQTDILVKGTGIAIVSLGAKRILRFRKIAQPEEQKDFALPSGSLLYMSAEVQSIWQHALPKSPEATGRMSLTFRQLQSS